MTREEKSLVIDNLTAQLADNNVIYVTDLTGLNAQDTTALRRACFKANIKLAVVKNTLLAKAMEASEKEFGELPNILKGNTSLMYAEVGNVPAKLIPNGIAQYVKKTYPQTDIYKIQKKRYGYEIELANGLDLEFNAKGQFLRIDD